MNNLRLLASLLVAALPGVGVCVQGQTVVTLDEVFDMAETHSAQLRPSFTAQRQAEREVSVAKSARLPEIGASLSVSFLGDGFITVTQHSTERTLRTRNKTANTRIKPLSRERFKG